MFLEVVGITGAGISAGLFYSRRWALVFTEGYEEEWQIHRRFFTKEGALEYLAEEDEEAVPLSYGSYGYTSIVPIRSKFELAYIPWNPRDPIQVFN